MRSLTTIALSAISLSSMGQAFYTESKNTVAPGQHVTIENSFPKGGLNYTNPAGEDFVYAVCWTRVTNETAVPMAFTMHFPADSFLLPSDPETYFKLILPPNPMTADKAPLFNYGLKDLGPVLDGRQNKPSILQTTISPNGSYLFYVVSLYNRGVEGVVRAELLLKDQALFYKITGKEIPCGELAAKQSKH